MPSPLISVIVPIYNMESLLPRCQGSRGALPGFCGSG